MSAPCRSAKKNRKHLRSFKTSTINKLKDCLNRINQPATIREYEEIAKRSVQRSSCSKFSYDGIGSASRIARWGSWFSNDAHWIAALMPKQLVETKWGWEYEINYKRISRSGAPSLTHRLRCIKKNFFFCIHVNNEHKAELQRQR